MLTGLIARQTARFPDWNGSLEQLSCLSASSNPAHDLLMPSDSERTAPGNPAKPRKSREELRRIMDEDFAQACTGLAEACMREHREWLDRAERETSKHGPAEEPLEQGRDDARS